MIKKLTAVLLTALLLAAAGCSSKTSAPSGAASASPSAASSSSQSASASPSTSPEFVFTRDNYPRVDGSTSTIPLGQAIASVLLGEPRDKVTDLAQFNKTTESYRNLMNGSCDILIAAEPNASVFDEMKKANFQYELTPVAMDALVFMVNASNPVDNLTTAQVQQIYTGKITNWKQVGGDDAPIKAFQRNADSGSQSMMQKLVMKDLKMASAPEDYMIGEMEGLIKAVKNFDGSAQAIGYTVYYYANDMKMADGLKILSIDGVKPEDSTIAASQYPFINPYYTAIAASQPKNSPARVMYNWLQSAEGQTLIKSEGYVPVSAG